MSTNNFDELIVKPTIERIYEIFKTKGLDYSSGDDRLSNFKETAGRYGISPLQTLAVYRDKHSQVINKYLAGGEVRGEPIEDKILDEIVYDLLLLGLVKESETLKTEN